MKDDIYVFKPGELTGATVKYTKVTVTEEKSGKSLGTVMLPQEEITALQNNGKLTETAIRAFWRLQRARESLDPERMKQWAAFLKEKVDIARPIAIWVWWHILRVYAGLKIDAGEGLPFDDPAKDPRLKAGEKRLTEAIRDAISAVDKDVYENLADYLWVHVVAWALDRMEEELGAETVNAMSQEDYDRAFNAYLFMGKSESLGDRFAYLLNTFTQDYARLIIEALDLPHKTISEIEHLLELHEKATLPQEIARAATLAIPTNPQIEAGFRAIWGGGRKWRAKGIWTMDQEAGTASVSHKTQKGGEVIVWVDPKLEAHAAIWTMQQIEAFIEGLSPLTADVALAVLAALGKAPRAPMLEPVRIDADDIIRMKGIDAWGKNRDALRVQIEAEMENLQRLKFEVHKLPAPDPETGRWNPKGYSWTNDRLFDIVKVEEYQKTLFGDREVVAVKWTVRAGQWAYYFLSPQARRWVCGMSQVLLALSHREDRRTEVLAKKIGQYVMMHTWRLGLGQPLTWTIGTLCKGIGEAPEQEEKPGRFREAFEQALELLAKSGVFSQVIYPDGYWEDTERYRGWVQRWLKYEITFVLPSVTELEREIEARKIKQLQEAKQKKPTRRRRPRPRPTAGTIDGRQVRLAREQRNIRQEELARYLGISRRYLSDIENQKVLPGPKVAQKLKAWFEQTQQAQDE